MSDDKPIINIRIRELRRERALTQEELAAALGISRQSVNAMEAGRCLPSLPVALQIASFFSVPLSEVFGVGRGDAGALVPFSQLRDVRQALAELMEGRVPWQAPSAFSVPAANVYETEDSVIAELYLPGYEKDALSIEVGEDFLTVSGEAESLEDDRQYSRREFARTQFQRTLSLPALVEADRAEAEMKGGVLTVIIPKVIEEKPKTARISIKSAE